jgi:hypothetical protein
MDIEKIVLPSEAFQEVTLMKRRIEYLESIHTLECAYEPSLLRQLKEMYADVDIDLKTFSKKLADIHTEGS